MSDKQARRAADLTREGLEHYGRGDTAAAILAWKAAQEQDPEDATLRDYLKTADRRRARRNEAASSAESIAWGLARDGRDLMHQGDFEGAFRLLRASLEANPGRLELEASLELARAHLFDRYRDRLGALDGVPVLRADERALTAYNLPADAGFLISLMDGATSLADLISVSGMDGFDALHVLHELLEAELVEVR